MFITPTFYSLMFGALRRRHGNGVLRHESAYDYHSEGRASLLIMKAEEINIGAGGYALRTLQAGWRLVA